MLLLILCKRLLLCAVLTMLKSELEFKLVLFTECELLILGAVNTLIGSLTCRCFSWLAIGNAV